jgi:hypothetical protein
MSSLIHKLKADFPEILFFETEQFSWSPVTATVSYAPNQPHAVALLLHELAHGLLGHREYRRDIELLAMETTAWEKAKELAEHYTVRLPGAVIQDHLDTYREWMDARSTCPECHATGYQTSHHQYACPACTHEWRVNEARLCGLKRSKVRSA